MAAVATPGSTTSATSPERLCRLPVACEKCRSSLRIRHVDSVVTIGSVNILDLDPPHMSSREHHCASGRRHSLSRCPGYHSSSRDQSSSGLVIAGFCSTQPTLLGASVACLSCSALCPSSDKADQDVVRIIASRRSRSSALSVISYVTNTTASTPSMLPRHNRWSEGDAVRTYGGSMGDVNRTRKFESMAGG